MKRIITLLLWQMGLKGKRCVCSFYRASHYEKGLEFDINYYPCASYTRLKEGRNEYN